MHSACLFLMLWLVAAAFAALLAAAAFALPPPGCGLPNKKPVLHPVPERIENVTTGAWIWTVNICIVFVGQLDCNSLVGLVVGNSSRLYTRWILTAMSADTDPRDLIVAVGANTFDDLIVPQKVNIFMVKRVIPIANPEIFVYPMLCLLELDDPIILSEITKIVPVCLPEHRMGDEVAWNNTPSWVVGWTNNWVPTRQQMVASRRQFFSSTQYAELRAANNSLWAQTRRPTANCHSSINDVHIREAERKYCWPLGRRPDDHFGLSELGRTGNLIRLKKATVQMLMPTAPCFFTRMGTIINLFFVVNHYHHSQN